MQNWAAEHGHTHLPFHLEYFIDRAKARTLMYADWDAAFQCAVRDNWAKLPAPQPGVFNETDAALTPEQEAWAHDFNAREKARIAAQGMQR